MGLRCLAAPVSRAIYGLVTHNYDHVESHEDTSRSCLDIYKNNEVVYIGLTASSANIKQYVNIALCILYMIEYRLIAALIQISRKLLSSAAASKQRIEGFAGHFGSRASVDCLLCNEL